MPLVQSLHDAGLPMGTLLAFMMSVVALSLPEMILLRRVLKPQLIGTFVAVVGDRHRRRRLPVQRRPGHLTHTEETTMIIKVLGPGCTNCKNLERVTREAVADLGLDATIEKIEDYATIVGYGVMSTPGLVVNEKVVVSGRVPTVRQVRELLADAA